MRILHCYSGNLYGGVEAMLATLGRSAAREPARELEMEYALCFPGRLRDELHAAGAAVHDLGPVRLRQPWTVLRARRRLAEVLRAGRFDALITHACWAHALLAPAARAAGRPVVFWQRDLARMRSWTEWLAARTPPVLALSNSRYTASTLPRLFPGVPVEVVYNPVEPPPAPADPAAERAAARAELGTPPGTAVVIQACRMEPWKGHMLLLEALGRLRDRTGWVAWIVGGAQRPHEQAHAEALRARAAALGIADRVRFLGQRRDVRRLLAAADIHCQPNLEPEPFGNIFVEALHAGLPVVSVRMGGAVEIVTPSCGVLVEPGDADGLAGALGRLIGSPAERDRLAAAGPARAAELCDPAQMLGRLADVLGGLAAETPAGVN